MKGKLIAPVGWMTVGKIYELELLRNDLMTLIDDDGDSRFVRLANFELIDDEKPFESPDEWVTQDVTSPRDRIDEWQWVKVGRKPATDLWAKRDGSFYSETRHGKVKYGEQLHVRCRRKNLPRVIPVESHDNDGQRGPVICSVCGLAPVIEGTAGCKDCTKLSLDAVGLDAVGLDAVGLDAVPGPVKTLVRLWHDVSNRVHVTAGDGDRRWTEILCDGGFWTEWQEGGGDG